MKGNTSSLVTVRLPDDLYVKIKDKATKADTTMGLWLRDFIIKQATRSHKKGRSHKDKVTLKATSNDGCS